MPSGVLKLVTLPSATSWSQSGGDFVSGEFVEAENSAVKVAGGLHIFDVQCNVMDAAQHSGAEDGVLVWKIERENLRPWAGSPVRKAMRKVDVREAIALMRHLLNAS